MKIGIQLSKESFSERWVAYCEQNKIDYKLVDCYRNDIVNQLSDCQSFMWHFHQNNPKDILFARQLIYSIEASGKLTFPDFHTMWHFDDKVGQKYLLESLGIPMVPTWIFYNKQEAMHWVASSKFPKVFKLRGGAGSQNVKLIRTKKQAISYIKKAFGRGFPVYDAFGSLKERWRLLRIGKGTPRDVMKGIARFIIQPPYAKIKPREKGYIYFQEFIPNNESDIRTVVIDGKAFAIKRMVRENDFRASGSGNILYERSHFDENWIKMSFEIAEKLRTQCVAFDFIFENGIPLLVEINYGFAPKGYDLCPGYWDMDLNWHEGKFNPYGWMVDNIVKQSKKTSLLLK